MINHNGKSDANNFLFIAHPGHELCVHAWLTDTKPKVCVLTDGSGHGKQPRIASTSKLLQSVGAEPGPIYARFADAELYRLILDREVEPVLQAAREFAEAILADHVTAVTGDAMEGYNPAHDVCRLIINTAVRRARRRSGWQIANRDFLLVGRHVEAVNGNAASMRLTQQMFEEKLEAARNFHGLQPEVQALFSGDLLALQNYPQMDPQSLPERNTLGSEAYRVETLRPVADDSLGEEFLESPPFYERYGEWRVADGYYNRVIRYREHILPLAQALASIIDD